jgi:hypothetical protein
VVQEYERLDELAYIGGADEASDGSVPPTVGRERDSASTGAHGSFGCILDVETKGAAGDYCCS